MEPCNDMRAKYEKMTVKELKSLLNARGSVASGNKAILVHRLLSLDAVDVMEQASLCAEFGVKASMLLEDEES